VLPGFSTNPRGRAKKTLSVVSQVRKILAEKDEEKTLKLARAIVRRALDDERQDAFQYVQWIGNRIDGPLSKKISGDITMRVKVVELPAREEEYEASGSSAELGPDATARLLDASHRQADVRGERSPGDPPLLDA
jgi:hypothetical protein